MYVFYTPLLHKKLLMSNESEVRQYYDMFPPNSIVTTNDRVKGVMNVVCECYNWWSSEPTPVLTTADIVVPPGADIVTPDLFQSDYVRNQQYKGESMKRSLDNITAIKKRTNEATVTKLERPTYSPFKRYTCYQLGNSENIVVPGETIKAPLNRDTSDPNGRGIQFFLTRDAAKNATGVSNGAFTSD